MDLTREWTVAVPEVSDRHAMISYSVEYGFRWHCCPNVKGGFSCAVAAINDLLDRHGDSIPWWAGEDALRKCREYDFARKLQQGA